jgi:hypothetical protein
VGSRGVGIMNSTAFSLLANNSSEVDENQQMELMIGSLSFFVRFSGSTRLSDPAKPDPIERKTKTITMSGSSVSSSSEVNSPVSFAAADNTRGKIEELDKTLEELDIGGIVDKSHISQKDFVTRSVGVSKNIHQLCVIITEAAEENDHADNTVIDAQVDKSRSNSKKEKEKIHVSTGEWRIIMSAINHGMEELANSRREVLMGYQYALHQHKKRLREEKDNIRRSQENNSVSSRAYWDEYNEASESSGERHKDPKHNRRTTAWAREENHTRSISAHPSDDEEDFVQESVPTIYTTRTRRSTGAHPPSRNKKPRVGRRRTKETFSREKDDTLRGQGKGKHQVPILTKSSKRLIRRRKAQNMKGGCKEYHNGNKSYSITNR